MYAAASSYKAKVNKMSIKDTVTIKSGLWEADICARLGGNVIALRYDGQDVFRPLSDESQLEINPYIQGAPILLPANRTYLGKFSFEGKDYELPITEERSGSHLHGLVHRQEFSLVECNSKSVTLKYSNRGEVYPFNFDMLVTYETAEDGFLQKYVIKNTDTCNMPYTFCLHSTFVEPESFSLPLAKKQEDDERSIPTGRYLDLNEQEQKYLTGSPSKGIYVVGYFESAGSTAIIGDYVYDVSENFDYWILYNAEGIAGYICIEPQAGKVNGLNIDGGCVILSPGEEHTYCTKISRK